MGLACPFRLSIGDIKLLRDELAKVIGDNKRFMKVVGDQGKKIIELTLKVDQSALERRSWNRQTQDWRPGKHAKRQRAGQG